MNWQIVTSSRARSVAFDKNNKTVFVTFKDRAVYAYGGVNEFTFRKFMNSSSIGKAIPMLGNNYKRV